MLARGDLVGGGSTNGPWHCPHCDNEITPILDPEEYDYVSYIGEGGVLTADCWYCEKPVTVRCFWVPAYEVLS